MTRTKSKKHSNTPNTPNTPTQKDASNSSSTADALPPYLQQLKAQNQRKVAQRRQKKQQKNGSDAISGGTQQNSLGHSSDVSLRLSAKKKKRSAASGGDVQNNAATDAYDDERPRDHEPIDLSILRKESTTPATPTTDAPSHQPSSGKKRKREFLSSTIVNEFEAKKRKVEQEEKLITSAEVSTSSMKTQVIQQQKEDARKVIPHGMAPNVDVEVVYKEEITDPMDMPLKPLTEIRKFLHSHFYEQKARMSTALYMMSKQKVRKFKPAYNFVTKENQTEIPQATLGGEQDDNGEKDGKSGDDFIGFGEEE